MLLHTLNFPLYQSVFPWRILASVLVSFSDCQPFSSSTICYGNWETNIEEREKEGHKWSLNCSPLLNIPQMPEQNKDKDKDKDKEMTPHQALKLSGQTWYIIPQLSEESICCLKTMSLIFVLVGPNYESRVILFFLLLLILVPTECISLVKIWLTPTGALILIVCYY